ncbi:MAG: hypothetical protein U9Q21_03465 [Candidatus Auribacterota bacterium]|nr:hypothetical protein [Candidatus Auribacterota bacterium]
MKKVLITGSFIFVVVVAISLGFCQLLEIYNNDFETGDLGGWTCYGNWFISDSPGDVYRGKCSAVIDLSQEESNRKRWETNAMYQDIRCHPEEKFEVSVYISVSNLRNAEAYLRVEALSKSGDIITGWNSEKITGNVDYEEFKVSGKTPVGTVDLRVLGYTQNTSNNPLGKARFDFFSSVEMQV